MTFEEFKERFSIHLNPQQEAAVQTVDGPVLLLAVPGSGKTTVLVTRLGYMIYVRGISPRHILTMTYTVAATADMRSRFSAVFGDEQAEKLEFRTINGVSSLIIRRYERNYHRRAFALLNDTGRQASLIGDIFRRTEDEFPTESTIRNIQTAITYAKNMMLTDAEIEELKPEGVNFPVIYREYCRQMRENSLMDYDDQMLYAYQILRRCPEILQAVQAQYHYFCVDEAQDTSRIQHAIIRLLAHKRENLFMVGDEDQSIYGFRAAYPQALMDFAGDHPGSRILLMEQNYRSTRQIVEAADHLIQKNKIRHPKKMIPVCGSGPAVAEIPIYQRRAQYRYLERLAADCKMETAVLYRDNDSALPVIDLLDRAGLGYRCRQLESTFFTHQSVRDITDIIQFARCPEDGERFLRIYYKFGAGISRAAAEAAVRESRRTQRPVLEALLDQPDLPGWVKRQAKGLSTHCANLLTESADRAVYRILHFMGYEDFLINRGADLNKVQILEALGASEPTPVRLLERLEELRQVVQRGTADPSSSLILSTIHSSKGLEYDRVILMDVMRGILPKADPPGNGETPEELAAFEEERRLFYVAMTRAKKELLLFRFKKEELDSPFAAELFPPKETPAKPAAGSRSRPWPKSASLRSPERAVQLRPGMRVEHRSFGGGTVRALRGDLATIEFDDGEERSFLLSAMLEKGLLAVEKD